MKILAFVLQIDKNIYSFMRLNVFNNSNNIKFEFITLK